MEVTAVVFGAFACESPLHENRLTPNASNLIFLCVTDSHWVGYELGSRNQC